MINRAMALALIALAASASHAQQQPALAQFQIDPFGGPIAQPGQGQAKETGPAPENAPIAALSGRWATLRRLPQDQRERWALQQDVEAGRVDPLRLVAQIARAAGIGQLPIPPGARYHEECSRAVGLGGAVFTFGLDMHPDGRALLEQRIATQHERRTGVQAAQWMNALEDALQQGQQGAVVRRAEAFLRSRGYKPSGNSSDHLIQANIWLKRSPEGRVPPDVTLMSMMSYPQCALLLPVGPALHLSVTG